MRIVWSLFRGVKSKYRATRMYLGKLHRATLFILALVLGLLVFSVLRVLALMLRLLFFFPFLILFVLGTFSLLYSCCCYTI
jgi:hypothetical protein